ncbi:helix-turn-helix domain-containing protein [Paracoccus sp. S-4012]|uniref:helix-turn-helix domain-containing protein n=1 Tax=Paracoccus sp. S-4012 TaxID=2665648 RepID=UPI0012B03486|nr:helix-turn-helix domain-containing protein [Paracoccus sp. S-4012]MRX49615.1 helix-turn-helix domain-containing protein [Paracoccus sp. S-4012]
MSRMNSPAPPPSLPAIKGAPATTEVWPVPNRGIAARFDPSAEGGDSLPLASPMAPVAQRPVERRRGLRVMPLGAFLWGGPGGEARAREDHVLVWCHSGAGDLHLGRNAERLGPGALRWLPAGTAFAWRPAAGADGRVLLLSPDLARELPDTPAAATVDEVDSGILAATLAGLAAEARRDDAAQARAVACHLGLIAVRLARAVPAPAQAQPARPLVEALLERLRENPGGPISLADHAAALGTDLARLDRACREIRGQSALELMQEVRREKALTALRTGRRSLDRIAADAGFSGAAHLARAITAATGRLPQAFQTR